MDTVTHDPIVEEVRAIRDAHAVQFDYEIWAIFKNLYAEQSRSRRKLVRFPARRIGFADFEAWREELHRAARFVQTGAAETPDERDLRTGVRLVELVDLSLTEDSPRVFGALLEAFLVEEDNSVYQSIMSRLFDFPAEIFGRSLVAGLPRPHPDRTRLGGGFSLDLCLQRPRW